MKQSGKVVLLTASPETVYERVKDSSNRPVLNGHMNVEYIADCRKSAGHSMRRRPILW